MISFTLLTNTPAQLRDFLIARDVIEQYVDPVDGQTKLRGVLPGMEWVRVPNPVIRGDGTPDPRNCYLVKFAWDSEETKFPAFRDWIINNSTVVEAPADWTLNGEHPGSARKITNLNVWLVHDRPERFGIWQ